MPKVGFWGSAYLFDTVIPSRIMGYMHRLLPILLGLGLITSDLQLTTPPPGLDYVEWFSGDRAISRGLDLFGFSGRSFDIRYHDCHNLLSPAGSQKIIIKGNDPCNSLTKQGEIFERNNNNTNENAKNEYVENNIIIQASVWLYS